MGNIADINLTTESGHLGMAFQAQVIVTLDQHLIRDRPVRLMADRATFAQRFMMENHRTRLLAMAFSAAFIHARHACRWPHTQRSAMRRFKNIGSMRIVALDAIHPAFEHGVMLRQLELRVNIHMARETRFRIAPGIHDELASASSLHMQAARPVTGFTSSGIGVWGAIDMQTRVRTRSERSRELGMTIDARFVADESRSLDLRRSNDAARNG